jgi:outer membrane receptor protein involved in Fe transport
MVSHAHGQGYADLHFVIPETVERVDVHKGPYYAEFGNLATAGAVQLGTRARFERPFLRVQAGSFGTGRAVFGVSPRQAQAWVAGEVHLTDGPYRRPQDFTRLNAAGKWRVTLADGHGITVAASGYRGQWNASGQIPSRLVAAGVLDRFDAIDPSEGGRTARLQASTRYDGRMGGTRLSAHAYAVDYSLDLFSNFTFFARDAEQGDGILQRDRRVVLGGRVAGVRPHMIGRFPAIATAGAELRRDRIDVSLLYQRQRVPLADVTDSDVHERDLGLYAQEEVILSSRMRTVLGIRHDRFAFDVRARGAGPEGTLTPSVTGAKASIIVSPIPGGHLQLFANYGRGFHSNDARAAVSGPSAPVLPVSNGYELGMRHALGTRAELSAAWWLLDLESEFTWVGDEGITDAGGATRRHGIDVEGRVRLAGGLWVEGDLTAARGRYRGTGDLIARAPRFTMNGGLVLSDWKGWSGQLRARHVADHPAVEDGSVDAAGFTVADAHVRRRLSASWDALVSIENVFDASYREAQTFFPSRLAAEPAAVDDVHFTPGNPRAFRAGVEYRF